jgi:hypothetical protein
VMVSQWSPGTFTPFARQAQVHGSPDKSRFLAISPLC